MNRPGFIDGAIFSIVISIVASLIYQGLGWLVFDRLALQMVVAGTFFSYVLYLLLRSKERAGRITVVTIWVMLTALLWTMNLPLIIFIVVQACMTWLVRSLYYYASVLSSLVDLILTLTGILAAVWAIRYTNSLLFSIWCFYLIQALFVTIPVTWQKPGRNSGLTNQPEDRFEHAYHCAETAVRKLSSVR